MQAQLPLWQLRAEFAVRLAALYGAEVPAYNTLVEVSKEVNSDFVKANGADAERLGSIERVTAERHGAIRVGSPTELAQVARIFAGFGMHAVGFYDLRDASKSSVPVVSTAFRPIEADELARNPFRVFTSMLVSNDPRFFDEATQDRLEAFISQRQLFSPRLLELADLSTTQHGLAPMHATEFLDLATAAFKLSDTPIDRQWYRHLESISAVAADIGGVSSTHINHLTPPRAGHRRALSPHGGTRHRHDRRDPRTAALGRPRRPAPTDLFQSPSGTTTVSGAGRVRRHRRPPRPLRRGGTARDRSHGRRPRPLRRDGRRHG
jgi:uncharacterized glyoxalase superfamily metalloenzyme YdcJ